MYTLSCLCGFLPAKKKKHFNAMFPVPIACIKMHFFFCLQIKFPQLHYNAIKTLVVSHAIKMDVCYACFFLQTGVVQSQVLCSLAYISSLRCAVIQSHIRFVLFSLSCVAPKIDSSRCPALHAGSSLRQGLSPAFLFPLLPSTVDPLHPQHQRSITPYPTRTAYFSI